MENRRSSFCTLLGSGGSLAHTDEGSIASPGTRSSYLRGENPQRSKRQQAIYDILHSTSSGSPMQRNAEPSAPPLPRKSRLERLSKSLDEGTQALRRSSGPWFAIGLAALAMAAGSLGHVTTTWKPHWLNWKPAICSVRAVEPQASRVHQSDRCHSQSTTRSCYYYVLHPAWLADVELLEPFPTYKTVSLHNPMPWQAVVGLVVHTTSQHPDAGTVGLGFCAGEVCAP